MLWNCAGLDMYEKEELKVARQTFVELNPEEDEEIENLDAEGFLVVDEEEEEIEEAEPAEELF